MSKVKIEITDDKEKETLFESLKPYHIQLEKVNNNYYLVGSGSNINKWSEGNTEDLDENIDII